MTVCREHCRRMILICPPDLLNIAKLMMAACAESQKGAGTPRRRRRLNDRGEIVELCLGELTTERHEPSDSDSDARRDTNAHVDSDAAQAHLGISAHIGEVDYSAHPPQFDSHFKSGRYAGVGRGATTLGCTTLWCLCLRGHC